MLAWSVTLILVLCAWYVVEAQEIGFVILKPTKADLQGVHLSTAIQIEVAIWADAGTRFTEQIVVCTAEILPEFDYGGGQKICIGSTNFYMSGLRTGSNLVNVTIELGAADSDSRVALASQLLLIDAVDVGLQRTDMERSQLARELSVVAPDLKPLDYFYYSNPGDNIPRPTDFTALAATDSYTMDRTSHDTDHDSRDRAETTVLGRVRLALFARIAPQFVPSDRFRDWICDHAFLAAQGVDVVVIAPATDAAVPTICGAPVVYFACLGEQEVSNHQLEDGPALLAEPAVRPLAQYLSQHVDALLVINTYGDAQTSLLLEVSHQLALLHRQGEEEVQGLGDPKDWHSPLVLMDLPNLGVRREWYDRLDGFVAPSRAVGLHLETTAHGKPVAIIYPPVRDLVIEASLCRDAYFAAQSRPSVHYAAAQESAAAAPATVISASSPGSGVVDKPSAEASLLDPQRFNVLFVGRLARVKSPGLLLKALGYLLATAEIEWEDTLSDSGESGEETVERRYRRELTDITAREHIASEDETQLGRFYQEFATSLLEEIRTAVRVTFVGGGTAALTQALQALAGALNVSTQVMLVGAQAPERVVQYMQQADVLVNPIVIGETFGLVHIEAAAQGLPVIAFDVRANAESVVFLGDSSERGQGSGSAETYGGASAGAGADAGGVVSKGVGVQSALLPYREGAVVQDLALALLTAYLQHRRRLHEVQDHQHPSRVHTEVSSDAAGYSGSSAVKAERAEVCDKVVPVFRHWNSRQHSRALVDALALFLRSASSQ